MIRITRTKQHYRLQRIETKRIADYEAKRTIDADIYIFEESQSYEKTQDIRIIKTEGGGSSKGFTRYQKVVITLMIISIIITISGVIVA